MPRNWKWKSVTEPFELELDDLDLAISEFMKAVHADRDQWNQVFEDQAAERVVKLAKLDFLEHAEERQWQESGPAQLEDGTVVPGSVAFRLRCAIAERRVPTWFVRRLAECSVTRRESD
jgi:hypothetical protein